MSAFLAALLPVICVIALGWFLARREVVPAAGWRAIEQLAYMVLFPALIIRALASAPFESAPWKLALALVIAQLVLGGVGLFSRLLPRHSRPATGSIIQSNVRWNTFIALSIASALFGDAGLALVTIGAAAMIPVANILSVTALTAHADHAVAPRPNIARELATNPLILACVVGIVIAASGLSLPGPVLDTLTLLADATLAVGLLCAGAGVDLDALRRAGVRTLGWSLVRLFGLPVLAVGAAMALGLSGLPLAAVVICASVPTATNSYILASKLGGDAPLAANLVAAQSALAAVTMPLVWWACMAAGLV